MHLHAISGCLTARPAFVQVCPAMRDPRDGKAFSAEDVLDLDSQVRECLEVAGQYILERRDPVSGDSLQRAVPRVVRGQHFALGVLIAVVDNLQVSRQQIGLR